MLLYILSNILYHISGILPEGENWTEAFRRVIKARLGMETQG